MTEKEKLEDQLTRLKEKRKEFEIKADNCDVFQRSLKIFLNSAYGAFGTPFYPLYDIDIAESTTIGGKTATIEMVKYVNNYLNNLIQTTGNEYVVAGDTDSVFSKAVVTIDNKTIEELFEKYSYLTHIQHLIPSGYEVIDLDLYFKSNCQKNPEYTYSLNGKTNIKTIIRHKVSKARYKITIDDKSIEVTGDHSIMVCREGKFIECKASEIKNTDYLVKNKL